MFRFLFWKYLHISRYLMRCLICKFKRIKGLVKCPGYIGLNIDLQQARKDLLRGSPAKDRLTTTRPPLINRVTASPLSDPPPSSPPPLPRLCPGGTGPAAPAAVATSTPATGCVGPEAAPSTWPASPATPAGASCPPGRSAACWRTGCSAGRTTTS